MKGKTKYILFYLMGLAEWAVIFCFLGMLDLSHDRLWKGYLMVAVISAIGSIAMYETRRFSDQVTRLKYRTLVIVLTLLAIGACFWWTVALARGTPPVSLDVASVAGAVILVGVCWFVYRSMLGKMNPRPSE